MRRRMSPNSRQGLGSTGDDEEVMAPTGLKLLGPRESTGPEGLVEMIYRRRCEGMRATCVERMVTFRRVEYKLWRQCLKWRVLYFCGIYTDIGGCWFLAKTIPHQDYTSFCASGKTGAS